MALNAGLVPTIPQNTQYLAPGLGQIGYDVKNLQDLGLLNKYVLDNMWFENRNRSALAKFLGYMSNQNTMSFNANKFSWVIGDEEASKTTLNSAFTNGTSTHLDLVDQSFLPGYVVRIAGTATYYAEVTVRLTSKYLTGSGYTYEQLNYQDSNSGTSIAFPTTSSVNLMASTIEYHSMSPDGKTVFPKTMYNVMERMRESVVLGKRSNTAEMIYRNDMQTQLRSKWNAFAEKLNYSLYFGNMITDPTTTAGDLGRMGGFSYFLQPHVTAKNVQSITDMGGTNIVFRGTTIDRQSLELGMIDFTNYGNSSDLYVFANPEMCMKIWYGCMRDVAMTSSIFKVPGTEYLWDGYTIQLATATLRLIPDRSLLGVQKYVVTSELCSSQVGYTGSTANTGTNNTDWALVINPAMVNLAYLNSPEEGGVQSPKPYTVDLYGRKNIDQMEYDATMSLVVKRPESCGFIQLKGS